MEAGYIYMFAGSTSPTGYLECDGSAVSRTTYADLFDVIGTTYGSGDGSTTFNLPDLSGKVAMGYSQTYSLGSTGGSETVVLDSTELPSHSHEVPQHGHANTIAVTTPALSHSITQPAFNYTKNSGTASIGSGSDGNNVRNGSSTQTATLSTQVTVAKHDATACTMSGSVTDCAAFDTESTGSSTAHNNMQPYITMMYIISTGAA